MTRREMEERYRKIVKKDTKLDAQEQVALLNLYIGVLDDAEVGRDEETMLISISRVFGAMEYAGYLGKIRDDEDLCMLLNEIEAFGAEVRKDWSKSPWCAKKVVEA